MCCSDLCCVITTVCIAGIPDCSLHTSVLHGCTVWGYRYVYRPLCSFPPGKPARRTYVCTCYNEYWLPCAYVHKEGYAFHESVCLSMTTKWLTKPSYSL